MRFCIPLLMSVCGLSAMKLPQEPATTRNVIALLRAVKDGELPLVKVLVEREVNVNAAVQIMTPLEVALAEKQFGVARILSEGGCSGKFTRSFW